MKYSLMRILIKVGFSVPVEKLSRSRPATPLTSLIINTNSPPIPGKYFTFRYFAKTPGLLYDQHPLIACLGVFDWGFNGFNFHLDKNRNYTWREVKSELLVVKNSEISYMKTIRYIKTFQNP